MDNHEIVELIASKFMGWKKDKDYTTIKFGPAGEFNGLWKLDSDGRAEYEWNPIRNNNHWWEIEQKLANDHFKITKEFDGLHWFVTIYKTHMLVYNNYGDTYGRALCFTILRYLGLKK